MPKENKFFRIATEGATTDGREISATWIQQMARNYDPKTYGARVNLEHIRGMLPDGPFKSYGDVVALKAEIIDGKTTLLAKIDPTEELVELSRKRQKIYTSMEVQPNFAKTGEAYLVGLAITDSPASLGTEMLKFSAQAQHSPLASRKQAIDNLFSEAIEIDLSFEQALSTSTEASLLEKARAMIAQFKSKEKSEDYPPKEIHHIETLQQTIHLIVQSQQEVLEQCKELAVFKQTLQQLQAAHDEDKYTLLQLIQTLEKIDASNHTRPIATGGRELPILDC